jgi:iron complex outermembrane recepter protein
MVQFAEMRVFSAQSGTGKGAAGCEDYASFNRGGTLMKSTNQCAYAVALVLAAAASQAVAQGTDKGEVLEEVTITAQKRSENLQDVPLSVTAIGAEQLEARGIESLRGLNAIAPNVMFRSNPGAKLISTVGIRGSVTGQPAIWVDAAVGLYLNGIYLGKSQGAVFDVVDIERVEVLRGPQGTLFGRNTEGGAINFITRAPSRRLPRSASTAARSVA